MFKYIVTAALIFMGLSANANLEVAAIVGAANTTFNESGTAFNFKPTVNTKVGLLGFFPIFPGISIRAGVINQTRKVKGTIKPALAASEPEGGIEDKLMEVPLNLQVGLPIVDLYVFGGVIYSMTQSTTIDCGPITCSNEKTPNDMIVNVGVGYDIFSLALFRWAVEAEVQQGTKNLGSSGTDIKQSSYGINTIFALGF